MHNYNVHGYRSVAVAAHTMESTSSVSTFYSTYNNLGKWNQEVQELLVMETNRKEIATSARLSSAEPSNSSSATSPHPADIEAEKSRLLYLCDQV